MDKNFQISKAKEVETVLKISQAVSRTLDLDKILDMSCRMTAQALKADRCSIGLLYTKDVYEIIHTYRKKPSYPSIDGEKFKLADYTHIAQNLLQGKAFHLYDHKKIPLSIKERKLFKQLNLKVFLAVPIIVGKKPLGAFHLGRAEESTPFSSSDINLCQTIANQVGIAIKNATLLKELKEKGSKIEQQTEILEKQFKEESILLEISKALSQTLDLKKLFEIVTKKTADLLEIDRCGVVLVDEVKGAAFLVSIYADGRHQPPEESIRGSIKDFPVIFRHLKNKHRFHTPDISQSSLSSKEKKIFNKKEIKSFLIVPLSLTGRFLGLLTLSKVRKQHKFTESDTRLCQAIANQLSVAVENARLLQNLQDKSLKIQQQADSLERQFKEQTILFEISKALSQTLDLKKLFEIVTQKTVELLGVDRAVAMIIDQNTGDLLLFTHFSRVKHLPELENYPKSVEDFPDIVEQIKTRQIFCISDVAKSSLSSREKKYFRERSIKSVLSIPFILEGRLLGILALNSITKKHEFTESEIKLAQAIANQLSVAIENAQLMELSKKHSKELEKLSLRIINAQEYERKNLAGKLHDVIAQDLTAIKFDLKMCQQTIPEQYTLIKDKLEECEKLATQSLENIRNLTSDLRPPILDHFGLASAIRWYIDSFKLRTTLKIKVRITEFNCKFPPEFETTIYRIIQEGLTNVTKHSQAKRVSVSLYKKGNYARIIIQDNGVGFELENLPEVHGFGLFRLKENTELLGGKFKIISNKGRGTKLDISLPWKEIN
jgi:signal transduction histidine kinase/ribosomal protein L22